MRIAQLYFPMDRPPPAVDSLRSEVRSFLQDEQQAGRFTPVCDSWNASFSPDFSRKLAQHGWLGMTWPRMYGGHERSAVERFVVVEELLAAGAPVAAHWIADRQTGPMLLKYGTEQQRKKFLPAIAAGECYFAIGMSEADSGSDLASVRTRAIRRNGGWRITGNKIWTSHAHQAHYSIVFCRTSSREDDRHSGLSQFIVSLSSPGITIRPILSMSGQHHFNEVILDDVEVPDSMVVGTIGEGWRQVTSELAFERSGPERYLSTFPLLTQLLERATLAGSNDLGWITGKMLARLSFIRRLSMAVAQAIDQGREPLAESALVKDLGTRFEKDLVEVARLAIEHMRPDADASFNTALRHATLASPGFTLRGGTTEILRTVISRGLSGS